ncbi:MAG TPA: DUF6600 domain-containing protein, partial [Vicinamibacteria bacterium]|nr:DUF6600 domain-containing protein [Vicinamibacteria bacterium]
MKRVILTALLFSAALVFGFQRDARAEVSFGVSVGFFHDSLATHGTWTNSPRYGYVWAPRHLAHGWRPYVYGRWVYTDYGWTWVSDEPFGWATYHYGRWYLDPQQGWLWVPGDEWGPAWVDWRSNNDYVGWAPLPPKGYDDFASVPGGAFTYVGARDLSA